MFGSRWLACCDVEILDTGNFELQTPLPSVAIDHGCCVPPAVAMENLTSADELGAFL